jgi:hypothetical protein
MSQLNELEKKLEEPIPLFDLAFCITNVDKTSGKFQVMVDIRSQALLNRFEELLGIDDYLEEPDLTSLVEEKVDAPESQPTDLDYSELTLQQKLDHLLTQGIIRKKKYDNYFTKVSDPTTAPGLLRYFEKQFDLLHKLYLLAKLNKMSDDTRATIYKRIMSSKMKDFTEIDDELKTLEVA